MSELRSTFAVVRDYWQGVLDGDWEAVRAAISDDVVFEGPEAGVVTGIEAHVALYRERVRFPGLQGFAPRGEAYQHETAFRAYELFMDAHPACTVVDKFRVSDGRITHVLSVRSPSLQV